jgi:transcriptional regulator with XRE-family HTH domain
MTVVPLGPALGHIVREIREARGMSLEALSVEAELNRVYLRTLESGDRDPTLSILCDLAGCMGIRTSDLIRAAEERDEGWSMSALTEA